MRILLVQSWLGRKQHPVLPVGLCILKRSLCSHTVRILDLNIEDDPLEGLKRELLSFIPHVVGFSLRNCDTTSFSDPFSFIPAFGLQLNTAAGTLPSARIIAGGAGFSLFHDEIMALFPQISCGVAGHGEHVIRSVVESGIPGVVHGGSGRCGEPDLDGLDISPYVPFQSNLSAGIEVNRGCGIRCRYCSYPEISGTGVVERDTAGIVNDALLLAEKGIRHLFMIAPVFNTTAGRGMEVAGALAATLPGITWEGYHTPLGFDRMYAEAVCRSGCTAVAFSPDGATDEQLELMGKNYSTGNVADAVRVAADSGMEISLNIFPWHNETGTIQMMRAFGTGARWGALAGSRLRRLRFSVIRRMPGTCYGGALAGEDHRIPRDQFLLPPAPQRICFTVLRQLFERSTV